MLGDRPTIPTKQNLAAIRVVKRGRSMAKVELVDDGDSFELPLALLPEGAAPGEVLSLKVMDSAAEEESHTRFAQQLLGEIMK